MKGWQNMSERSSTRLGTVVVAVVAAVVTGTALPAVGELLARDDGTTEEVTASVGPGRSTRGKSCDPTTPTYVSCGSVRLQLPRRGRVQLTLDGRWATSTAPSLGRCRFFGPGTSNEQVNFSEPTDSEINHHFGFNEVTASVPKGRRTFGLECREFEADTISFNEIMMSAVFVGSG
jgi:hypothetical protein